MSCNFRGVKQTHVSSVPSMNKYVAVCLFCKLFGFFRSGNIQNDALFNISPQLCLLLNKGAISVTKVLIFAGCDAGAEGEDGANRITRFRPCAGSVMFFQNALLLLVEIYI